MPDKKETVQEQLNAQVEFENINELENLIAEINEKLNQLKNFQLKVKVTC